MCNQTDASDGTEVVTTIFNENKIIHLKSISVHMPSNKCW